MNKFRPLRCVSRSPSTRFSRFISQTNFSTGATGGSTSDTKHVERNIYSNEYKHTCGSLGLEDVGRTVTLKGWIQSSRIFGSVRFGGLRDSQGVTQLVWDEKLDSTTGTVKLESVIEAKGVVKARPDDMRNPRMKTGDIEVEIEAINVLSEAKHPLPFKVENRLRGNIMKKEKKTGKRENISNQEVRLKHRYLDIRGAQMQQNLRIRSAVSTAARKSLVGQGFIEVETPTLFKSTPEGAREFLVPTRSEPAGRFYALPQSPQQYKQLLMVGGIDKYFQLARCYRDESGRPDRQPEFTQLDMEMAFVKPHDIQTTVEHALRHMWSEALAMARSSAYSFTLPSGNQQEKDKWEKENIPWQLLFELPVGEFERMTYQHAIDTYGTDKPDTRFKIHIQDATEIFTRNSTSQEQEDSCNVRMLCLPRLADELSNKKTEDLCKQIGDTVIAKNQNQEVVVVGVKITKEKKWGRCTVNGKAKKVEFLLKAEEQEKFKCVEQMEAQDGDLLLFVAGEAQAACEALGYARSQFGEKYLEEEQKQRLNLLWITDFPMFETGENGKLKCAHHPFTMPNELDIEKLNEIVTSKNLELLTEVRGQSFDLVCNGTELGGGSIRIHTEHLQRLILEQCLGYSKTHVESTFQHLLNAFAVGCPPHGGFALGMDRLLMLMCNTHSLTDVIAFPKSASGNELMTNSPATVPQESLDEYNLKIQGQ